MIKLQIPRIILVVLVSIIITTSINAEVPNVINYQGRLIDASEEPIDGSIPMTFRIYNSVGTELWTSNLKTVTVENGLFNYPLGFSETLPDDIFMGDTSLWLGIQISGDPEIVPRTRFTSQAFAYHSLRSDTAYAYEGDTLSVGSDIAPGEFNLMGTTTAPYRCIWATEDAGYGGRLQINTPGGDGRMAIRLESSSYPSGGGRVLINRDDEGYVGLGLHGNYLGSSDPAILMYGNSETAKINLNESGNDAVQFPDDAISKEEIADEPGVGNKTLTSSVTILTGVTTTILSRLMIFPEDGYAIVIATGGLSAYHANGTISEYSFGISTSDGSIPADNAYRWYQTSNLPSGLHIVPISVQGYFEVSAGMNYFYFLCHKNSGGSSLVEKAHLNVMYFPSNYELNF